MRHSPNREQRHRLIESTLTAQFATWPASVSCLRVWSDRDRFRNRPVAPATGAKFGRCGKGDDDHGHAISWAMSLNSLNPRKTARQLPSSGRIGLSDLHRALRLGWEDFKAVPSHAIMLCVIYPVLGLVLARTVLGYSVLPLLFPLAAGFALLGPFAALGLYELSRRRERGEQASAWDAIDVLRSPSFGAMLGLGTLLLALFVTWVATAQAIYVAAFGYEAGGRNSRLRQARADDAAGLVADRRRLRRRLPVRAGGAVRQRGFVPADARPSRRRRRRHGDLAPRGGAQSGADGGMGIDRRGAAGRGIAAVLPRPRRRHPAARPRHLASLSQGRSRPNSIRNRCRPARIASGVRRRIFRPTCSRGGARPTRNAREGRSIHIASDRRLPVDRRSGLQALSRADVAR